MIGTRAVLLGACLICCGSAGAEAPDGTPEPEPVRTAFAILVGYPSKDQGSGSGALLIPGTVIPLTAESTGSGDMARRQIVEKSLSFSKAAERLWATFRLDPGRQRQDSKSEQAIIGKPIELPPLEDANVRMTATLLRYDSTNATYRVVFRQGDRTLADSTAVVARGGRAVVGGMDGESAPYIFVFIEPDAPVSGTAGDKSSASGTGITEPKPIYTIPPRYPEAAKKEKVEGVVVLELVINTDGEILEITALEDPDPRLTQEAIDTVRQWKFRPALNAKGQPVKVHQSITFRFKLK